MPQVEETQHKSAKTPMIVGVVAGLVVVGIVVGVVLLKSKPKPVDTTQQTQQILYKAVSLAHDQGPDAAIALLKTQLMVARTDQEKVDLYLAMGINYENKQDYKSALVAYRQAEAVKAGFGTNEAIARAADADHQTSVALDYYQRNRTLIKDHKAPPGRTADLRDIEAAIVRLGGKLQ